MEFVLVVIVELLLLIPYVGWGVYMLRRRFRHHDDIPPGVEAATLAGVVVFFLFEIPMMRAWLFEDPLLMIFAVLGLFVSGTALYGHMAVSLVSWLLVDFVMPGEQTSPDKPRMGPAEALERYGDYEGALEGYRVLARIYPRNPELSMRIAENLVRLDRGEEACTWMQRAVRQANGPAETFQFVARCCELYDCKLGMPGHACEVLQQFIADYPDTDETELALERMTRLGPAAEHKVDASLSALSDAPLATVATGELRRRGRKRVQLQLSPLADRENTEASPAPAEAPGDVGDEQPSQAHPSGLDIAPIVPGEPLAGNDAERRPKRRAKLRLDKEPGDESATGDK
ncbi:MAG: tetratricopeptide repeat protein [Candidatus Hydrogenedentota bacterium]